MGKKFTYYYSAVIMEHNSWGRCTRSHYFSIKDGSKPHWESFKIPFLNPRSYDKVRFPLKQIFKLFFHITGIHRRHFRFKAPVIKDPLDK